MSDMLKICNSFRELDFSRLSEIYGYEEADSFMRCNDLYDYLREDFFRVSGAFYAVWEESGQYVSALRAEPYQDGYLIEALQTHVLQRCKGYAQMLLKSTLLSGRIPAGLPVYAHIHKKNAASLAVHRACGFQQILDYAVFIDGSVYRNSCTMILRG